MTTPGMRQLAVPDGLDGERLDAAMARMFGLSRSRAAELISDGLVLLDGRPAVKSDRVLAGDPLQVTLPAPRPAEPPRRVEGLVILYEDNDIVVVDKPRGVAAHPTPGWSGPTVIGGLVAAGHTVATSGAAERQGIVHRLDANTTGVMVVAKSERAYSALKQAFRGETLEHAPVHGAGLFGGHQSAADARLVGDEDQPEAGVMQAAKRFYGAWLKRYPGGGDRKS